MAAARIYLDHHATTPVDPRVLEVMLPWFTERFGNAASAGHAFGWEAADAVDAARAQVAAAVGADPRAIVFTSGTTESNNLAITGAVEQDGRERPHVITNAAEHKAVLDVCARLERRGAEVTVLPVDGDGRITAEQVAGALTDRTVLVSVMLANNEVGSLQPVADIGAVTRAAGVLLHCDAAQAVTKVPVDVDALQVDLCSFSAHKMYGPKGVGALFVRRREPRVRLAPQQLGGGHERGLRSGTLPVPLIVGFGEACRLGIAEQDANAAHCAALRDRLWAGLTAELDQVTRTGHPTECLPGNLNAVFACIEAEGLLMQLPDVACSAGSACTAASLDPSHVLLACGLSPEAARASVRFGIGKDNTAEEIDRALAAIVPVVRRLRAQSPLYTPSPAPPPDAS
ncbi:MAG: cysteine desulfurase family protein [Planctomycetota bacterium]|jgi:cysteine desulfurase